MARLSDAALGDGDGQIGGGHPETVEQGGDVVDLLGVDPVVGQPVAHRVLPQRHRRRRVRRADDLQRVGGGGEQDRPPGEERLQHGVAEPHVREDPGPEDVGRHDHHLAGLGHPCGQVRPLAGDQAHLAEEAAGAMPGDQLVVRAEHLHRTAEDDDPVVVVVGRGEQHLAGFHAPALSELEHDRQLLVVELGERHRIGREIGHEVGTLSAEARSRACLASTDG